METQNGSKIHRVGVIMNGVTGRMGTNQHYIRSILAIRKQGGVKISDGEYIIPDPVLVGRNEAKLRQLASLGENIAYTTDLDSALNDPKNTDLLRRPDYRTPRRRRQEGHRSRQARLLRETHRRLD